MQSVMNQPAGDRYGQCQQCLFIFLCVVPFIHRVWFFWSELLCFETSCGTIWYFRSWCSNSTTMCLFRSHHPVTRDDSKTFLSNFLFVLWLHFSTRQQKSPQHQSNLKSHEKYPLAQEFLWKLMMHVLNHKYVTKH